MLYNLGAGFLYRVHLDLHKGLELPKLPLQQMTETYPISPLTKALDANAEWSRASRLYREILSGYNRVPPELYGDLVDAVTSKWAAEGRLETLAQKRTVATFLLGRLEAGRVVDANADGLLLAPENFLEAAEARRIRYAAAKAGEYIAALSQRTRSQVKQVLYQHEISNGSPLQLAQQLSTQFAALNRDWRRIALTETANNRANGFLGGVQVGEQVKFDAAPDCCEKCHHYHDTLWTVKHPEDPQKDPDKDVWVGKRWEDGGAVISLHPHCRCRWMPVLKVKGDVNQDIKKRAMDLLEAARKP